MANTNKGTRLNPAKYKTFIPDQYKQGVQREEIGNSTSPNFFETLRTGASVSNSDKQPIRTLEFVRERILKGINK